MYPRELRIAIPASLMRVEKALFSICAYVLSLVPDFVGWVLGIVSWVRVFLGVCVWIRLWGVWICD